MDIKVLVADLENVITNKEIEINNKKKKEVEGHRHSYVGTYEHGIDEGYVLLAKNILKLLEIENE